MAYHVRCSEVCERLCFSVLCVSLSRPSFDLQDLSHDPGETPHNALAIASCMYTPLSRLSVRVPGGHGHCKLYRKFMIFVLL